MINYSIDQWLFFFYFYCVFGWCFESAYMSVCNKKLTNRGFMRGPYLPIYGAGGLMMMLISIPSRSILYLFFAGAISATILEFLTGTVMEAVFKASYWDYSDKKFNYKGIICPSSTIAWGVLTVIFMHFLYTPLERVMLSIPVNTMTIAVRVLTPIFLLDFAFSFSAAMSIRDILIRMEELKSEALRLKKRLDVLQAFAGDTVKKGIGARAEAAKLELAALNARREAIMESIDRMRRAGIENIFGRGILRGNPTMKSIHFPQSLNDLREQLKNFRK
ncbi:MAG: putative ABC transporter permease [Lachnospiraceae bacterium]|nr:putative ABC transporter permease [Lachnospiraceae bacterium]